MPGRFILTDAEGERQVINNTLARQGENALLQMLFQGENTTVPAGTGNYYLGLCGLTFTLDTVLTTLAGEPTFTNGYARQALQRSTSGWISLLQQNGVWLVRSAEVSFTPTGPGFSTPIQRAFIATSADNSGKLIAVSGPLPALYTLPVGQAYNVQYEFYLST